MNRLKELRNKRGISQSELAKMMNVSQNAISKWENGQNGIDINTLLKLASLFNVTLDYLLGRTDENETVIPNSSAKHDDVWQLQPQICAMVASAIREAAPPSLTDEETELLNSFRSLSDQGRAYILQTMAMATQIYKKSDRLSDMAQA